MIHGLEILLFAAGAAAAFLVLHIRILAPFNQLREALRRLAGRDFRPVLLKSKLGVFRETSGHVREISELLQQLDQQIADEGFSLRVILSSMVEGVLIADRSLRIRLANEPIHKMFELTQSPINRSVMEVFRSHELQQAIEGTLEDGSPRRIELPVAIDGPETRYLEVYAAGLHPKPGRSPLGAVVVFHDITPVRNLEAVRREFVANVSHEFRTPLAIINGYIETLLDGALDDRPMTEHSLRVMYKNGQRLTLLIEDLLTISKMEQRSEELDVHPVDIAALLRKVNDRLEPAIAARGAEVTISIPDEPILLEADSQRLEQVFANLLENALRYGPADSVRITITLRRADDDIEVLFADNGPGIPYDDQPHIFERFYRVHKDRSRGAGGTGLGLSIVKHIVLAHGGSVSVTSVPGDGACFCVRLPLKDGVQSDGQPRTHSANRDATFPKRPGFIQHGS